MLLNVDEISGIVDMDSALKRVNGNSQLLFKLLKIMKEKYENSYEDIVTLIENNNIEEAILIVHTIKGAAGNLSINNLYNSALNLELALRENKESIYDLLELFKKEIETLRRFKFL